MMKIAKKIPFLFLLYFTLSSMSCEEDDYLRKGSVYKADYLSRKDFENSVKLTSAKTMKNAGKIYLKDNYMFITDVNKGFHVYDNTDPENPNLVAFVAMPGVTDIAIRDNVFYANQAVDLIAFKINMEAKQIQVLKRIPNTFPELVSPDGYIQNVGSDKVVVDWIK